MRYAIVIEKADGNYKRYYPVGLYGSVDKQLLSLLRQEVPRRIVMKLLLNPGINFKVLSEGFPVSASTLSYHLSKLLEGDVVRKVKKGRESLYYVNNQEEVAKVLLTHRKSFLDNLVESFANESGDPALDGNGVEMLFHLLNPADRRRLTLKRHFRLDGSRRDEDPRALPPEGLHQCAVIELGNHAWAEALFVQPLVDSGAHLIAGAGQE